MLVALDHVQLAMPPGGETTAEAFYAGVLGLVRVPKPCFAVRDLWAFVAAHGLDARWSDEQPGTIRCYVDDPFGNRLELVDAG
jgi:hypothetical protein